MYTEDILYIIGYFVRGDRGRLYVFFRPMSFYRSCGNVSQC